MAFKKTATIAVKTGSYTDHEGKQKNRYEYIGRVMTDENGGKMYFLNRTFNPAGCPINREGDDAVLLSIFEDKPRDRANVPDGFPTGGQPRGESAMATSGKPEGFPDF